MAKLITTDAQLRAHIPNIIASVKGEVPFIERLALFLDLAEDWVRTTFTSETTFNTICGYTDSNPLKVLTSRLVVADALRRASKPRVDRLIGSMLSHRDDCIAALLPGLVGASKWLASDRATFFGATLFPDLRIVDVVGGVTGSKWDRYLELRPQVIDLEASLAEEWLSPELMSALRSENLRGELTEKRHEIVRQVKAQVVGYLRGGSFYSRRLADIVNYIRLNESDFKEWHGSKTAELFAPPVFRNRKEAKGYFF